MLAQSVDQPILFVTHRVPYPPDKGDRIRCYNVIRNVARRATVHLACLADEEVTAETRLALQNVCAQLAIVPHQGMARWARALKSLAVGATISEGMFHSPVLLRTLREWARTNSYHSVFVSASSLVPYLRLPELDGVPAVVDLVDVDSQKWLDYAATAAGPRAWAYSMEGRRLRRLEAGLPTWVHAVTLVSKAEADLYRTFCSPGNVREVVNGVDLDYFQPAPVSREEGCVFVGALDYRPNVLGAVWFCEEVWPAIRERRPDATLTLVGRRPVPAVRRLARLPGVVVAGQVPDVRPYLARAAICVVPLAIARGVQNKVLEALAMGKAVAASPASLQGLALRRGHDLLACGSKTEWIRDVDRLFGDPIERHRLGQAGRAYVEAHHHWDRCLEPFDTLLGISPPVASSPRFAARPATSLHTS